MLVDMTIPGHLMESAPVDSTTVAATSITAGGQMVLAEVLPENVSSVPGGWLSSVSAMVPPVVDLTPEPGQEGPSAYFTEPTGVVCRLSRWVAERPVWAVAVLVGAYALLRRGK
jgi:hypothetical protein